MSAENVGYADGFAAASTGSRFEDGHGALVKVICAPAFSADLTRPLAQDAAAARLMKRTQILELFVSRR